MKASVSLFGKIDESTEVYLIELSSKFLKVKLSTYGACITSIQTLDKNGQFGEVVLGFDKLDDYLNDHPYFGVIVGPVANRISGAQFSLNDRIYSLPKNDGQNNLHSGPMGLDKKNWTYKIFEGNNHIGVRMSYDWENGDGGFPGNINFQVSFSIDAQNNFDIAYSAYSDQDCIVNLTHHEYFNLKDGGVTDALDHELIILADNYTPTLDNNCLTGEIIPVEDSAFDLREIQSIGTAIKKLQNQNIDVRDFDHNFVVNVEEVFKKVAHVFEIISGRQLEIFSNQPCIQFYTASHMDGSFKRNDRQIFKAYHGFCLESQSFPDAINKLHFPSVILKPNEKYNYKTRYIFSLI